MKEILDSISLCQMIAHDGLGDQSYEQIDNFVKEHFAYTKFENEFVKQQFEKLAREIVSLRYNYEYLKN
jgi:hypothetical protein